MSRRLSRLKPFHCPYEDCVAPLGSAHGGPRSGHLVRKGRYWRKDDSKWISRFSCLLCRRSFSSSRFSRCFKQRKRRQNAFIQKLLGSGVSLRRTARLLRLNRKTVVRKSLLLAKLAQLDQQDFLKSLEEKPEKLKSLYFDEMESFERSKCLPLSIPLAVMPGSRKILAFRVALMPAKGPLAEISRQRYGRREDHREKAALSLFSELKTVLDPKARITTDENPKYPGWLRPYFPDAEHKTFKGRRGCVVGQGELKKIGFDPLFDLNHSCAMIRANVNRLFRRTWCTTKRRERLEAHLHLYVWYHNSQLT